MKFLTHLAVACLVAFLVLFAVNRKIAGISRDFALDDLVHTVGVAEKNMEVQAVGLVDRLRALGNALASDRNFPMKVLVEKDPAHPEVTEIAARHMAAMGLTVLEVTDEHGLILSCGHFPAGAGNESGTKFGLLDARPAFVLDNIRGEDILTFQAKVGFECAGVTFYCLGGFVADSCLVHRLSPHEATISFVKFGGGVPGRSDIESISEISDNRAVMNDAFYLAASLALPWVGQGDGPTLILLREEPEPFSLLDLL